MVFYTHLLKHVPERSKTGRPLPTCKKGKETIEKTFATQEPKNSRRIDAHCPCPIYIITNNWDSIKDMYNYCTKATDISHPLCPTFRIHYVWTIIVPKRTNIPSNHNLSRHIKYVSNRFKNWEAPTRMKGKESSLFNIQNCI